MRKIAFAVVAVVLAAVALTARQQEPTAAELASPSLRVGYDEFKKLYDRKAIIVVDTRDEASFEAGHIPGARLIPMLEIDQHITELRALKRPIVTYCS